MSKVPEVSIIMPNRCYEGYIGDAIRSVKNQTFTNWECIIVDDMSIDDSVKIIEDMIKDDNRFKFIKCQDPVGLSVARNKGLETAQGKWIAFLNSDDCLVKDALERMLAVAEKTGADVVGGQTIPVVTKWRYDSLRDIDESSDEKFVVQDKPQDLIFNPRLPMWHSVWRRIYKRDLLGVSPFLPKITSAGADIWFMLKICHKIKRLVELELVTVMHRIHDKSIMNCKFTPHRFAFFPVFFQNMREEIVPNYSVEFIKRIYRVLFVYLMRETIMWPRTADMFHDSGKRILKEASRQIPLRFLSTKHKILCWYFKCVI